ARAVFHRVHELLHDIHPVNELQVNGEVEVFVTDVVHEATHPIGEPITDDIAFCAAFGLAGDGTHRSRLGCFIRTPSAQTSVAPIGTQGLPDTEYGHATRHKAGAREDVFIVFTKCLDAIFIEV